MYILYLLGLVLSKSILCLYLNTLYAIYFVFVLKYSKSCDSKGCLYDWWHISWAGLQNLSKSSIKDVKFICPWCTVSKFKDKFELNVLQDGSKMDSIKEEIILDLGKVLPNMIESAVSKTLNNCLDKRLQQEGTSTGRPFDAPNAMNNRPKDQEKHVVVLEDSDLTELTWATVT